MTHRQRVRARSARRRAWFLANRPDRRASERADSGLAQPSLFKWRNTWRPRLIAHDLPASDYDPQFSVESLLEIGTGRDTTCRTVEASLPVLKPQSSYGPVQRSLPRRWPPWPAVGRRAVWMPTVILGLRASRLRMPREPWCTPRCTELSTTDSPLSSVHRSCSGVGLLGVRRSSRFQTTKSLRSRLASQVGAVLTRFDTP